MNNHSPLPESLLDTLKTLARIVKRKGNHFREQTDYNGIWYKRCITGKNLEQFFADNRFPIHLPKDPAASLFEYGFIYPIIKKEYKNQFDVFSKFLPNTDQYYAFYEGDWEIDLEFAQTATGTLTKNRINNNVPGLMGLCFHLRKHAMVKDNMVGKLVQQNCFLGLHAVNAFVRFEQATSRTNGKALCEQLLSMGFIKNVTNGTKEFIECDYYRINDSTLDTRFHRWYFEDSTRFNSPVLGEFSACQLENSPGINPQPILQHVRKVVWELLHENGLNWFEMENVGTQSNEINTLLEEQKGTLHHCFRAVGQTIAFDSESVSAILCDGEIIHDVKFPNSGDVTYEIETEKEESDIGLPTFKSVETSIQVQDAKHLAQLMGVRKPSLVERASRWIRKPKKQSSDDSLVFESASDLDEKMKLHASSQACFHVFQDRSVTLNQTEMIIKIPVRLNPKRNHRMTSRKDTTSSDFSTFSNEDEELESILKAPYYFTAYLIRPLNQNFSQVIILRQVDRQFNKQMAGLMVGELKEIAEQLHLLRGTDSVDTISAFSVKKSIHDFKLLSLLGKGGYGKVFLGKRITTGKLFAIKVLRKTDLKKTNQVARTITERAILSQVRHPSIVHLYSAFTSPSKVYMVLDYVPGGDLFTRLRRRKCPLSISESRQYLAEVILALEHLHALGIVYRDLKPENVLIETTGHIKITDFGLSRGMPIPNFHLTSQETVAKGEHKLEAIPPRNRTRRPSVEALRLSNSFCGTEIYMAPEMLLQNGHGAPVDWWCVGLLLCEMTTGRHPFRVHDHLESLQNIVTPGVSPIIAKELPEETMDLIHSLLQRIPSKRLGSGVLGAQALKQHPFFTNSTMSVLAEKDPSERLSMSDFLREPKQVLVPWNWEYCPEQMIPQYRPTLYSDTDTSNFESRYTSEPPVDSLDKPTVNTWFKSKCLSSPSNRKKDSPGRRQIVSRPSITLALKLSPTSKSPRRKSIDINVLEYRNFSLNSDT